jgi:hypothetical protein
MAWLKHFRLDANSHYFYLVIPAKAGIQWRRIRCASSEHRGVLGPGFRRDDGVFFVWMQTATISTSSFRRKPESSGGASDVLRVKIASYWVPAFAGTTEYFSFGCKQSLFPPRHSGESRDPVVAHQMCFE